MLVIGSEVYNAFSSTPKNAVMICVQVLQTRVCAVRSAFRILVSNEQCAHAEYMCR